MHRRAAGAGNIADIIKCCLKDITMIHAFIKRELSGFRQPDVDLRKLSESPKVEEISVMMGTPANKSLLR